MARSSHNLTLFVIESLEKVLELNFDNAFVDLLQLLTSQTGWTVIATGRDYAFRQLTFNYLQPRGIYYKSIHLKGFDDEQLAAISQNLPELNPLLENEALAELLHIPFFIELASRVIQIGGQFASGMGEKEFRKVIWEVVIEKQSDRKGGMPAKRKAVFVDIAKARAKQMLFGIPDRDFDAEVIAKLEEDHLIYRDNENALVSPMHDVLEDWALEDFIQQEFIRHHAVINEFLNAIGDEPAINRAFRLWLFQRIKYQEDVADFITGMLVADKVEAYWKDEVIAAVLQSEAPEKFLDMLSVDLLKNDNALLIKFCLVLRLTCQKPDVRFMDSELSSKSKLVDTLHLTPYGKGWDALFQFIYQRRDDMSELVNPYIVELTEEWCLALNIFEDLPAIANTVGLIALWQLELKKNIYRDDRLTKILSTLIKVAPAIKDEFNAVMQRDIFVSKRRSQRANYADKFVSLATVGYEVPMLCKRLPEFVKKLTLHEWLLPESEGAGSGYDSYHSIGVEHYFGLKDVREFFPASGAKGPFKYLLIYHPQLGLDFILELCNLTAEKYSKSKFATVTKSTEFFGGNESNVQMIELKLNDGTIVSQYASAHLWKGYRELSTLPYLLQCALMALENWLIDYINVDEFTEQIPWLFDYILRNSNSVMTTAVLASVAIGYPAKVGKSSFALLRSPILYDFDLQRVVAEQGENTANWFANQLNREPMQDIYVEERKVAALRPLRNESLETLLVKLQFNADCHNEALKIVNDLQDVANETNAQNLRFMLHRVDTRLWAAKEDKENNRILLQNTTELPEDLIEVQQGFNAEHTYDDDITKLKLWTDKLVNEKIFEDRYFASYKEALAIAMQLEQKLANKEVMHFAEMSVGALVKTAVVCLRDSKGELTGDEIEWCAGIVFQSALIHADRLDMSTVHDPLDTHGAAACAYVLPTLFDLAENEQDSEELEYAITIALTHGNLNVAEQAAKGVRDYLWSSKPEFAQKCLNGALAYSAFRKNEERARVMHHIAGEELEAAAQRWQNLMDSFRQQMLNDDFSLDVENIALTTHCRWHVHLSLLLVPVGTKEPLYFSLIKKVMSLTYKSHHSYYGQDEDQAIDHKIQKNIQDCFVEHLVESRNDDFALYKDILIEGCHKAPMLAYSIKLGFDVVMENYGDFDSYWRLWSLLAPTVQELALKNNDQTVDIVKVR